MSRKPQQTVKLAIDCETNETIAAEDLLRLDEAEFSILRRATLQARVNRKRGINSARFLCSICKHPLFLSRFNTKGANRWFVHDGKSEQCPWHEGNRLSPDQTKALIYRGQQEGAKHHEYKNFLAKWLKLNASVSDVCLEQTTYSEVMKGEWRRPDVKCTYKGQKLVFEIQLSYTFLSDVIERDAFYKREGIFIIWIFSSFDLNRATVKDEAFFNRRNLFVLDADAMQQTLARNKLTFSGYRHSPCLIDDQFYDVWESDFIALEEVNFPRDTFRPYFFDYEAAKHVLEARQIEELHQAKELARKRHIEEFMSLALRYYESDHADNEKAKLLAKVDALQETELWDKGFYSLRDYGFYGWHGVLAVLLSIKFNRPVSYNHKLSVFQVIEAGLRSSHRDVGSHAYAILYLWAYKIYKPHMSRKNQSWLSAYAHKVKDSINRNESTYKRFIGYDEAISFLLPELGDQLQVAFGR